MREQSVKASACASLRGLDCLLPHGSVGIKAAMAACHPLDVAEIILNIAFVGGSDE